MTALIACNKHRFVIPCWKCYEEKSTSIESKLSKAEKLIKLYEGDVKRLELLLQKRTEALQAIRNAPGGGPAKRIATQALNSHPSPGESNEQQ